MSPEIQAAETAQAPAVDRHIASLNRLLRGELTADATYSLAIHWLDDPDDVLHANRDSHRKRAAILRQRIIELGGEPSADAEVEDSLARLVQRGPSFVGRRALYAALEDGEDRGLDDYRAAGDLDHRSTWLVGTDLLPSQKRSHARMRGLQERG